VSALSQHVIDEIRVLPGRFPQPRSAVMPALDLAQEEIGHLTPEAMTEVAAALNLDAGYVEGVATFYSLFHMQPIGKHRFYMCTNLSCSLRGANELVDHLQKAIGVSEPGEVSKDGMFSYEAVECLGACEFAPMVRLDHLYHYDLTNEKIDALVEERRNPRPHLASPPGGEGPAPRPHLASPHGGEGPVPKPSKPRAPRKKKADG
jgi:NADH-quinone oxidoreductase subunit E